MEMRKSKEKKFSPILFADSVCRLVAFPTQHLAVIVKFCTSHCSSTLALQDGDGTNV